MYEILVSVIVMFFYQIEYFDQKCSWLSQCICLIKLYNICVICAKSAPCNDRVLGNTSRSRPSISYIELTSGGGEDVTYKLEVSLLVTELWYIVGTLQYYIGINSEIFLDLC